MSGFNIYAILNKSRKAVQPQLLYRMTGNPRFRNMTEDQSLYRFLLEEGLKMKSKRLIQNENNRL